MKVLFEQVQVQSPLVHNITNYVTVNDCANVILAAGGSPLMADDQEEVADIVSISKALYINVGTLNRRTIESMKIAGKRANEMGIPVILDPVGMGASRLRNESVNALLKTIQFSVIKGNMTEIRAIDQNCRTRNGVDVESEDQITSDTLKDAIALARDVAKRFSTVVVITGATDIVTDGVHVRTISNGDAMMSRITGTGCMTGSLIGTFAAVDANRVYDAATIAVSMMGLAGEKAAAMVTERQEGTASMKRYLIDQIMRIDEQVWKEGAKIENQAE